MKKLILFSFIFAALAANAQLKVLSSGYVGVGTTSPQNLFHVHKSTGTTLAKTLQLTNSTTGSAATDGFIIRSSSASGNDIELVNQENGKLSLYTNNSERLTILSGGNIGISNTTPPARLTIYSSKTNSTGISVKNYDVDLILTEDAITNAGKIQVMSGGNSSTIGATPYRLLLQPEGGYVGIGTISPNNLLQVAGLINFNNTLWNTFLGYQIGLNTTGNFNTATGYNALYSNTSGNCNTGFGNNALNYNTQGSNNTGIGLDALMYNSTGVFNTALGCFAGGGASGVNINECTFIGAVSTTTVARTNVTMLGYGIVNGQCTGDNQVCVGNTSISAGGLRAAVTGWTAYSDARFKTNIKQNVAGLSFILKLKPVTYNVRPRVLHEIWGTPDSIVNKMDFNEAEQETRIGFVAQDVEAAANACGFVFPGLDVPTNSNEVYCLRYTDFIMPIVKSIQELNNTIDSLKTLQKASDKLIADLQQQINNCCTTGSTKDMMINNSSNTGSESNKVAYLMQNVPNPFSTKTTIRYYIPENTTNASLLIFDMQGKLIKTYPVSNKKEGYTEINGGEMQPGMYMYSLIIDGKELDTKRMILTE